MAQKRIYELAAEASLADGHALVVDKSGQASATHVTVGDLGDYVLSTNSVGDLGDVVLSSPVTDGSVLRYDGTSGKWVDDGNVLLDGTAVITVRYSDPIIKIIDTNSSSYATTNVSLQFRNTYATVGRVEQSGETLILESTSGIGALSFRISGSERCGVYPAGFGLGTTAPGGSTTTGTNVLSIADGTAPAGGVTGQVSLYSSGGGLEVMMGSGRKHVLGDSVDLNGTLRVTGVFAPTAGSGIEMYYSAGQGNIFAYNRDTLAFLALRLRGAPIILGSKTVINSTSTASAWLDINGDLILREVATPSAPPADAARLFTRDDGGGLTEFGLQFSTGDIQILGKEGYTVPAYTTTNVTTARSLDVSAATLTDVANVLATLIEDMRARGWFN